MSAEVRVCITRDSHVFWIFFRWGITAKFHCCRICVTDLGRGGGLFVPPIREQPQKCPSWIGLKSIIRTGLPALVEVIDLVNSCYNFSVPNDFTQMLTFLLEYQTVILTVLLFWTYFFFLTLLFILQWLSLHWENLIMSLPPFPLTFIKFTAGCPVSSHSLWLFSCWFGRSLWLFEKCSMGGYV